MKKMRSIMLGLTLGIIFMYAPGCTPTEEPKPGTCTGCAVSQPWSKPGLGICYVSQAECEQAQGAGCVLCD